MTERLSDEAALMVGLLTAGVFSLAAAAALSKYLGVNRLELRPLEATQEPALLWLFAAAAETNFCLTSIFVFF